MIVLSIKTSSAFIRADEESLPLFPPRLFAMNSCSEKTRLPTVKETTGTGDGSNEKNETQDEPQFASLHSPRLLPTRFIVILTRRPCLSGCEKTSVYLSSWIPKSENRYQLRVVLVLQEVSEGEASQEEIKDQCSDAIHQGWERSSFWIGSPVD